MQLILHRGNRIGTRLMASGKDLKILLRMLWTCVLSASPRRAWLTTSMLVETAVRRPLKIRMAVEFALMHKHLYEYSQETCRAIEQLVGELKRLPQELSMLPASSDAA